MAKHQLPRGLHGLVRAELVVAEDELEGSAGDAAGALLAAVSRGEFTVNGFRNRDLQGIFFSQPAGTPSEARRRSAWVSRKLRLLRAHGLIRKVPGTHRYHVTATGRKVITAILTALRTTVRQLTPIAA